ncbi:ubiquitin-like protein 7 [Diorhabda carinulata]|uniref:ubiquitin-like protein 7 n=1 Tax=Diorhabda carinulata TaxID=1163345 RepID=UPI0025A2536A|nr:ubiquitin-like protein 7 [Diorhabda carinulata]
MANIILGIWGSQNSPQRIKINNVDLENKVQVFKKHALNALNNVPHNLELSYCGLILEDENTLSSYGITDGVTIHVIDKPTIKPSETIHTQMGPKDLINAFSTLVIFPNYRLALQRLTRTDVINKIIEACPKLLEDPAAVALIQDPELIFYLSIPENGAEMIEKHPVLLEAGSHILAHVHEEQASLNTNQPSTSTGYSYSLEALSDDDEEMDSSSDTSFSQNPLSRNTSFNAITAAQLAAAIANATNTQFNTNSAGIPTQNSGSSNIITNEMFSNAIQQAINFGGSNRGPNTTNNSNQEEEQSFENLNKQWEAQLKQMHEMGLLDDTVNIRALKAVNGDVNAAIELVLSLNEME